jgi:hypothetical protein
MQRDPRCWQTHLHRLVARREAGWLMDERRSALKVSHTPGGLCRGVSGFCADLLITGVAHRWVGHMGRFWGVQTAAIAPDPAQRW